MKGFITLTIRPNDEKTLINIHQIKQISGANCMYARIWMVGAKEYFSVKESFDEVVDKIDSAVNE